MKKKTETCKIRRIFLVSAAEYVNDDHKHTIVKAKDGEDIIWSLLNIIRLFFFSWNRARTSVAYILFSFLIKIIKIYIFSKAIALIIYALDRHWVETLFSTLRLGI